MGGRWHFAGTPVVYLSESLALAAMETFVHLPMKEAAPTIPYVWVAVSIPETVPIRAVGLDELPEQWDKDPAPEATKRLGQRWLDSGETALLQVPSSVIPQESNFLLNPLHPDFKRLEITGPEPFDFDSRLFQSTRSH